MKKSQLFASCMVIGLSLLALPARADLVSYGVKAGLGIYAPTLSGSTTSAGNGMIFGGGVDVGLGPISVLADLLYAQRTVSLPLDTSQTLNFLQLPVQAELSLGLMHFSGGLYYALGLGSVSNSVLGTASSKTYAEVGLNRSDMGGVIGVGVGIPAGLFSVSLDLRYNMGFTNLSTVAGVSYKTRSFDVLAGVMF